MSKEYTAEDFYIDYAKGSGIPIEKLKVCGLVAHPCDCGEDSCKGYKMVTPLEHYFSKKEKMNKSAVVLTIHDAADMHEQGKRDIANWLRRQADFLEAHADEYSSRYTARYLYDEPEEE